MPTLPKDELIKKLRQTAMPVPKMRNQFEQCCGDRLYKLLMYGDPGPIRIAAGVIWGAGKETAIKDWKQRTAKGDQHV